MEWLLPVHVVAAGLGLVFGWVALSATKGASLHRRSGLLFVCAMLAMSVTGAVIASFNGSVGSVVAGWLTAYLVTTALLTVRPPTAATRRVEAGAMLGAMAVGVASVRFGVQASAAPSGTIAGIPSPLFFVFGTVALLSSAADVRMMRSGGLRGGRRLARHLWRMCFAFLIASASFFLGPRARVAKVLPEPLLSTPLLVLPVLLVFAVMIRWLWRVRVRQNVRGIVGGGAAETA